jgi:alkylation response protein AidB-like acyl-CoA dehydrogenase
MTTPLHADQEARARLVTAARDISPLLADHAAEGERLRRLPDASFRSLREAGMFRLTVPRALGGFEVGVRSCLEVTSELSRADASAGWVAMVMAGAGFLVGLFGESVRNKVWGADPDATVVSSLTPSGTASPVEGGAVVSGRWPWASGADHAHWALVAVRFPDHDWDDAIALIPATELKVEETWQVAGMSGTGSNTLLGEEIFVPSGHFLSMPGVLAGQYGNDDLPLYRTSYSSLLAITITGPILGMASKALELALTTAPRKSVAISKYRSVTDSPSAQTAIADAASLFDTAALHACRACDDIDRAAFTGRRMTVNERTRVRMDAATATSRAKEAVDLLVTVSGASSFALSNPLQRIWRDLGVASRHGLVNPNLARELYGRALLGIEEQPAFMI